MRPWTPRPNGRSAGPAGHTGGIQCPVGDLRSRPADRPLWVARPWFGSGAGPAGVLRGRPALLLSTVSTTPVANTFTAAFVPFVASTLVVALTTADTARWRRHHGPLGGPPPQHGVELRRYGVPEQHDRAYGQDARGLRHAISEFLGSNDRPRHLATVAEIGGGQQRMLLHGSGHVVVPSGDHDAPPLIVTGLTPNQCAGA